MQGKFVAWRKYFSITQQEGSCKIDRRRHAHTLRKIGYFPTQGNEICDFGKDR